MIQTRWYAEWYLPPFEDSRRWRPVVDFDGQEFPRPSAMALAHLITPRTSLVERIHVQAALERTERSLAGELMEDGILNFGDEFDVWHFSGHVLAVDGYDDQEVALIGGHEFLAALRWAQIIQGSPNDETLSFADLELPIIAEGAEAWSRYRSMRVAAGLPSDPESDPDLDQW